KEQENKLVTDIATLAGEALSSGGQVTRGGMDLSKGGQTQIKSIWELIGSTTAKVRVGTVDQEIPSPWPADTGSLPALLPALLDVLSISADEYYEGRINVNQARREVLIGLPNMTDSLADSIVIGQQVDPAALSARTTTGWLFTDGLVDIWAMRELDKFLTARGDVYRAQILGFFDGGGPVARIEVVVDGTQMPPRVVFCRDLNDLGRGYSRLQLLPAEMR
ncbi:MAG TPA: hypothetical protein VM165_15465, partial [Planctomycetaceae bacterium]|nr:hypothetical protein [Planctomycetaceae bacterium]